MKSFLVCFVMCFHDKEVKRSGSQYKRSGFDHELKSLF